MAETLTFENTQEATSIDNLNDDEQDSLRVGEAMQEQQKNLLAGKYKDAQELESAYIELQKKLGDKGTEASESSRESESNQEEEKEEEKETEKDTEKTTILDQLWEEAQSGEKFNDETLAKLKDMSASEIASMHLDYRAANRNQQQQQTFTEQDVVELKNVAGGEQEYSDMLEWANTNLNKQEIDMFDKVMEQGNPLAAFFAVRALSYRYNDFKGYDGKMLTGTAPKGDGSKFRSQAEVIQAMSDPKYDRDPAYRNDVMKKLERSNVNF